jgi:hypothetical protein
MQVWLTEREKERERERERETVGEGEREMQRYKNPMTGGGIHSYRSLQSRGTLVA